MGGKPWAKWEDDLFRAGLPAKEIARRTGRSKHAISNRRRKLGLQGPCKHRKKPKPWDDEQRMILYWLTLTTTRRRAALIMDRSVSSIRCEAHKYGWGFRYKADPRTPKGEVRRWEEEEVKSLVWNACDYTQVKMGEELGRSIRGIQCKAETLGVYMLGGRDTQAGLARELGVSIDMVRNAVKRLGVRLRKVKGRGDLTIEQQDLITEHIQARLVNKKYVRQYKPLRFSA